MAARSLLTPFHVRTKTTALSPPAVIPIFQSWHRKSSRARHARFFCNHQLSEMDMPKYREKFAHRMAMAGIKPHHRLAIAVSGGPDSVALCVLTAAWKSDNSNAVGKGINKSIDGLLAIVVDHALRTESAEEANLVYNRVLDMGIKCIVARCEWLDGRPKLGHLQEAARNKRYETLQNICIQQKISTLLIAHHADDQAELFILRLSRNSGVLGLAGMAFISQMFAEFPDFSGEGSTAHGMLLVRPLLEFSKEDMYDICRGGNKKWVEDPTNRSTLYARNRIRMSLNNVSSSTFKVELQSAILACRRTRAHVDKLCHLLLIRAVIIMPHGYAVIDLGMIHSMDVKNIYLAKFVAVLLQFISQRHKPVRGNALKLLLGYLRSFPCKTSLNVAGCYLCPAPGSKGSKVLVCCSVDSSLPLMMKLCGGQNHSGTNEVDQIVTDSEAYLDVHIPDSSSVPFLDATSCESVLNEAKRLEILSDSTYVIILSLQKEESDNFKSKAEAVVSKDFRSSSGASLRKSIYPGQVGYFMNRFVLDWKVCNTGGVEGQCSCYCCIIGDEMVAEVRYMMDADWIYLSELSKKTNLEEVQVIGKTMDYAILSASRSLVSLKSIPVAARRAMPVLVNCKGILLSIPSIGFSHCPKLTVSAVFNPRIPLGGGHSSFL